VGPKEKWEEIFARPVIFYGMFDQRASTTTIAGEKKSEGTRRVEAKQ